MVHIYFQKFTPAELAQSERIMAEIAAEEIGILHTPLNPTFTSFDAMGKRATKATKKYINARTDKLRVGRDAIEQERDKIKTPGSPSHIADATKTAVDHIFQGIPYAPIKQKEELIPNFMTTANKETLHGMEGVSPLKRGSEKMPEVQGFQELVDRFPKRWQRQIKNILNKKIKNGGEKLDVNDLMNAPAIFLTDMAAKRGCVYINGKIMEYPVITNGNSIRGVTKYTEMNHNDNPRGDASKSGSATVMGCALTGAGLSAKWIHGVDPVRMGGGKTRGCIGLKNQDMVEIGNIIKANASLTKTRYRAGKSNKKKTLRTEAGMLSTYTLNYPVINYTV